jgi:hypothetical protein
MQPNMKKTSGIATMSTHFRRKGCGRLYAVNPVKRRIRNFATHCRQVLSVAFASSVALYQNGRSVLASPVHSILSVSRFWFVWQVAFGCWLVYLSCRVPAPGIAIGVLGLLAVVATFESGPSRLQRSIWILISTGLLLVEFDAIRMDRLQSQGDQDYARAVDQTRFSQTSAALRTTIRNEETQRQTDLRQFNATISRLEDSIKT